MQRRQSSGFLLALLPWRTSTTRLEELKARQGHLPAQPLNSGLWTGSGRFLLPHRCGLLAEGDQTFPASCQRPLTGAGGAGCCQNVIGRLLPYLGAGCLLWEGSWLRVGSGWEGLWREEDKSGRSGLGETATAFMTVTSVGHCAGCVPHCASRGCGETGCCPPGRARV